MTDLIPRIILIEDDPIMGESIEERLTLEGYELIWFKTGQEALDSDAFENASVVVSDMRLPDMTGEELFLQLTPRLSITPFIFITAFGQVDQAVRLMKAGADDYIAKPFKLTEFIERIERYVGCANIFKESMNSELGVSKPMKFVEGMLHRISSIDSTVLLIGESGVGKERAAQYLHSISENSSAPFIAVNCGAIPGELIESELFGHEKGAFTGAHVRHLGYAERAKDGILLLDEIGELPLSSQTKLLRLLQERSFHRVGGEEIIPFKARLVCATNKTLEDLVANKAFREDLFYRINVIPINVPPLRERKEDILPLAHKFMTEFSNKFNTEIEGLTSSAEYHAQHHDWPGNVRELKNRMERAVALCTDHRISGADLFPERLHASTHTDNIVHLADARDEAERHHISCALKQTDGKLTQTAELLGISRTTLWEKMKRYHLDGKDGGESLDI